jgi:hypothetical protein
MANLEAVLQAIRDSVAKLRATIEIEEHHRRLEDCADPVFRAAGQCKDELARMVQLCKQMRRPRKKSKPAFRHLVSTENCSWKNILLQAFNE